MPHLETLIFRSPPTGSGIPIARFADEAFATWAECSALLASSRLNGHGTANLRTIALGAPIYRNDDDEALYIEQSHDFLCCCLKLYSITYGACDARGPCNKTPSCRSVNLRALGGPDEAIGYCDYPDFFKCYWYHEFAPKDTAADVSSQSIK